MTLPVPADYVYPTHRGVRYLPNFWGDHYTRLPDVYHRFALSTDAGVAQLSRLIPLAGLRVLDLGSGTGRSAFAMAKFGATVVGVDPSPSMREYAEEVRAPGLPVEFHDGSTSRLPEGRGPFDLVTSFHAPFAPEGHNAAKPSQLRNLVGSLQSLLAPGGAVAVNSVIPGWRHGWMPAAPVSSDGFHEDQHHAMARAMTAAGFIFDDEVLEYDYGSLTEALETYGFIYGPPAIDWLLERGLSTVYFGNRIYVLREE